ncbi:hypothetical protein VP01_13465g1 [Puccinia sorghi]|uniref:Uncharacterized protein n=1 Tax=Puccinia sorghi TaxID=27349 RepID=A0A0L6VM95_9BASI|nr:hypothetical protein VP01_13465g1 [Puccinia sorghi]
MYEINPTILKTTIKAIPMLTEENFSSWRTRITALFKLQGVKYQMVNCEPALDEGNNTIFCTIIIAKLSLTTHNNIKTPQMRMMLKSYGKESSNDSFNQNGKKNHLSR